MFIQIKKINTFKLMLIYHFISFILKINIKLEIFFIKNLPSIVFPSKILLSHYPPKKSNSQTYI